MNGREDFPVPYISSGAVPRTARHTLGPQAHGGLEGGHVPQDRGVIREVLDWFDTYLGPVK